MDYLGQDTQTLLPEADRRFLSRLTNNDTATLHPLSDFETIQCPVGSTIYTRELYNKELTKRSGNIEDGKIFNYTNCREGTLIIAKDYHNPDTIAWEQMGFTDEEFYRAMNLQYSGSIFAPLKLQDTLSFPKRFLTLSSDVQSYNPAQQGVKYPRILPAPNGYPDSRDFFYTLSYTIDPFNFIRLAKLFDLYRLAAVKLQWSSTFRTRDLKNQLYREYRRFVFEDSWQDLPDEFFDLFEMVLFGWSLGTRYIMNRLAYTLTDLAQTQAAYNTLSGVKAQLYMALDETNYVYLMNGTTVTQRVAFNLSDSDKTRMREVIQKLDSYLDIQKVKLAAAGAMHATPEIPYVATAERREPGENINIVYDAAASQSQQEPVFRDISVNRNIQFNAQNTPIVDSKIPLIAFQKAPEMMQQWDRTSVTPEGFALPPQLSEKTRASITPYVLGGLALAVAVAQLKG